MTPGGRGGRVFVVTTLADSGPGSLREAVAAKGPRIVVFRLGGTIELKSGLSIREPYITVAGHSAPGGGICIRGENVSIVTHDVVIRHVRFRLGDEHLKETDALSIASGASMVVLDHVSASLSVDETLSPSGNIRDVTVQWSIISESLWHSIHEKGTHGYGTLLRARGGVSLHHNLWAHHNGRNPRFGDDYGEGPWPTYDYRNNVIYNWGSYCSGVTDGRISVNYVANFLKPGPNSSRRAPIYMGDEATEETRFFVADNIVERNAAYIEDNTRLFDRRETAAKKLVTIMPVPFDTPPVETWHANDAYDRVLAAAGATLPRRDSVDERVVREVMEGSGRIIDTQGDVGGWPELEPGVPPPDADLDGMPDQWESARGLDPADPADSAKPDASGYTMIELWLNELAEAGSSTLTPPAAASSRSADRAVPSWHRQ
jgi:hypothetical protein